MPLYLGIWASTEILLKPANVKQDIKYVLGTEDPNDLVEPRSLTSSVYLNFQASREK